MFELLTATFIRKIFISRAGFSMFI